MMFHRIAGLIVSVLFVLSCSSSQLGWKEDSGSAKKERGKSGFVEDFDPLSLNDDDIVILPEDKGQESERAEKLKIEEAPPALEGSEVEMVQGFRVQLLATGDEAQAREARKDAIFKFPQVDVYLELEGSLYKLRIGDCRTKKEAEALREEAIRSDFRDAWIVPSKVHRGKRDDSIF
jgi:hypothetical protein